jgi:hypothetical protein
MKYLIDALPFYQDKLYNADVFKNLQDIVSKAKGSTKNELKSLAESFKETLVDARDKAVENHEAKESAQAAKSDKKMLLTFDLSLDKMDADGSEEEEDVKEENDEAVNDKLEQEEADDLVGPEIKPKKAKGSRSKAKVEAVASDELCGGSSPQKEANFESDSTLEEVEVRDNKKRRGSLKKKTPAKPRRRYY